MKRLFTALLLIPVCHSLTHAQCEETPSNKILLVGDSWAAFQNGYATINEGLKNVGHSDKRFISSTIISENGADTWDFVDGPKQDAIQELIDANPDVEIVHLSIGGNDVLGDWHLSFTDEQTDSLTETVEVRLRTIIDFLQGTRDGMRVFWPGYTYPNFGEILGELGAFQNLHPFFPTWDDMGQPEFILINTILNNMSDSVLAEANADPRLDFVPAQAIIQHTFGQTSPLGVAPGGTYDQFEAPMPLGYPEYPSPQDGMGLYVATVKDCFHLSQEGYLAMFDYQAHKFYQKFLMDDLYVLSDGGNADGTVSSSGTVSSDIEIGEDNGSELDAVLTFDVTGMADTTLSAASIFLRRASLAGNNPMSGEVHVKMVNGYFGTSNDVEPSDFMELGTSNGTLCVFGSHEEDGHWVRLDLNQDMLANISNQDQVQFMITAPGFTDGVMAFHDASDPEYAPILNLKYESPNGISNATRPKEFSVYPVPTTGPLTIDLDPFKLESIEVLNLMGKVAMKPIWVNNTIDVSSLPAGSYILRATTTDGVNASRIIKQ